MRGIGGIVSRAFAPCALAGVLLTGATALAAEQPLPVLRQILPEVTLSDPATGESVALRGIAARRPAVLLITDGASEASCPLAQALAAHQHEYAPWFSWTGIMSGPCSPEGMGRLHRASPVRFERCLHDPEGAVARALGIRRLPALVLANADGYVHAVCPTDEEGISARELASLLHGLASGERSARGTFADFRLPRVGAAGIASFLEVAGRDFTLLTFLHSGCLPCARQLEVLDYLRDRHAGRVSLVTIFLDTARDERILGYLEAARVSPDAVLRDPELRVAARYRIDAVPALLLVDAAGRIAYSRRGFREEERAGLYRDLDQTIGREPAPRTGEACPVLRDARSIHADACAYLREGRPEYALHQLERLLEIRPTCSSAHLLVAEAALAAGRRDLARRSFARYLAADPLAYDRAEIRERLASLLAGDSVGSGRPAP